jgi:hypothetical protein
MACQNIILAKTNQSKRGEINMAYTVVGLFDSKAEARAAMDELIKNGFVAEDIDLSEGRTGGVTTGAASTANASVGDSISNFFNHLFSGDETTARSYTDIARGAEAILTVQVDSQDRANRVAQIFDRHGAIDVNDRANQHQQNFAQQTGTTQNQTATFAFAAASSKNPSKKPCVCARSASLLTAVRSIAR